MPTEKDVAGATGSVSTRHGTVIKANRIHADRAHGGGGHRGHLGGLCDTELSSISGEGHAGRSTIEFGGNLCG